MIQEVVQSLVSRWDLYSQLILEHLALSFVSISIAGVLGLLLGIFISEYQKTSGFVLALVNIIYTIPSIALLGLLIPLSGIGDKTAVIALVVYGLLPMVRNTHTGITGISPLILEAARGMGSTRFQVLYKIKLPLALPVILAGLRNMVVMTIALAGIASFIGAGGLGVAIYRGITTNNLAMTITGSLLIAAMALLADFLLGRVVKLAGRRRRKRSGRRWVAVAAAAAACLALVAAVFAGATKKGTLRVATKPMTEQYILGEMLVLVIEDRTGLTVELTQGVGGGTANIQPAMEAGEFDLYPEYTGTGWNAVLKKDGIYEESMFEDLQAEYAEALGMRWVGMYGFNNTYGLALRSDLADRYGIRTYSDLAAHSGELAFGAEYDFFEREDGYDALVETYGFGFGRTMDLDIGLKYQAINEGRIDAMNIFTTDGQLAVSDITVLEDDLGIYPSYLCGNVVRTETLEAHPELEGALLLLEGAISDDEMARLNHLVESEGREPRQVAVAFLREKGLLEQEGP